MRDSSFLIPMHRGDWQTVTMYLLYLFQTTPAKIGNTHNNCIVPETLWVKVLFIHINVAENKMRHYSRENMLALNVIRKFIHQEVVKHLRLVVRLSNVRGTDLKKERISWSVFIQTCNRL